MGTIDVMCGMPKSWYRLTASMTCIPHLFGDGPTVPILGKESCVCIHRMAPVRYRHFSDDFLLGGFKSSMPALYHYIVEGQISFVEPLRGSYVYCRPPPDIRLYTAVACKQRCVMASLRTCTPTSAGGAPLILIPSRHGHIYV